MVKKLTISALAIGITLLCAVLVTAQGRAVTSSGIMYVRSLLSADGSAAAPSISFANEPSMGFFRAGTNALQFQGSAGTGGLLTTAGVALGSGGTYGWSSATNPAGAGVDTALARSAAGKLTLTGTTPMIQFGGTTSSFAAIKSTGASAIDFKTGDDASFVTARGSFNVTGTIGNNGTGNFFYSTTGPSAPSSCGTSPAVTTANGSVVFVITGGTGGAATGCTVTLPAATTGWACSITNITATAAHRANVTTVQTASTTTSVTWEYQTVSTGAATAFTASDVFRAICLAY